MLLERPMSITTTFAEFPLLPSLHATLEEKGLTQATEIQSRAIPLLLKGRTVVGVAETGSGKTLAYALPILHALKTLENSGDRITADSQPRAAVIVPTRELGEQVSKVFKPFTHTTRLRVRTVLGGTDLDVAKRNISGAFEVLVATPGRLVKLIDRGLVKMSDIRTLVFDEADQMLDPGFLPAANRIVATCPRERQLALFSATVSKQVEALMENLFKDAAIVRSEGSHRVVPTLTTENRDIQDGKRFPVLEELLDKPIDGGTVIFTNTREQCDKVAAQLEQIGHSCVVYRGEMDKIERKRNLKKFATGEIALMVSTDLASRGLDISNVGRVINYHMPQLMENYIHRAGRTARAGRQGLVINFVTERDAGLVSMLGKTWERPRAR
jgi:ATP-dependent RNA helicase RhlE